MKKIMGTMLVAVVLSVMVIPFITTSSCEAKGVWNYRDELIIRKTNRRGQGGWISIRPGARKNDQIRIGVGF